VADVVLVFHKDEYAVEAVLNDGLGGQADGDSGDASTCQQRLELEPEERQDFDAGNEANEPDARGTGDGGQCAHRGEVSPFASLAETDHAAGDSLEDASEDPRTNDDNNDLGQGSVEELLQISEPFRVELREEVTRLEPRQQSLQHFLDWGKHPFL